jgi:hypothetical protein
LALYRNIIAKNEVWKSHADHFGLTEHPRLVRAANTNFPTADAALVSSSL